MKILLPLSLIWLSLTLLYSLESLWTDYNLVHRDRIDLYNEQEILDLVDLILMKNENPDWIISGAAETDGILTQEGEDLSLSVLAVSSDYPFLNPLNITGGAFHLDEAVLIRKETAYSLFNSDDITGQLILFNNKLHLVAGIFELPPLLNELNIDSPDIITSLHNETLKDIAITTLQLQSENRLNINYLGNFLDMNKPEYLHLNRRFALIRQLRDILYLAMGLKILFIIKRFAKKDYLWRKKIYKESLKHHYRWHSLIKMTLLKPQQYIFPVLLVCLLLLTLPFKPYLPAEMISGITLKKFLLSPLSFLMVQNQSLNPLVQLPKLLETGSYVIAFLLFMPGMLLLKTDKKIHLHHILLIPVINIVFTFLFLLWEIRPVFDLKINLLLILLLVLKAAEERRETEGIPSLETLEI